MFLETDKVYLRALESSDLEFLYALENDVSLWRVSNTLAPFSKEVLQQYLEQAGLDIYTTKQLRLLICTPDHQRAGALDLFDFEPLHRRAGVGIVMLEAFQRRGFAREALQMLENYCAQYLLLHQLHCTIGADNEASIQLFQNAGYEMSGRKRQWLRTPTGWVDVLEWQKILSPES
jgi:diamine N-acetyltransferase